MDLAESMELPTQRRKNEPKWKGLLGILYATLAAAFASTSSMFAKYADSASPAQIVFGRCLIQFVMLLPILKYKQINPLGPHPSLLKYIIARGAFGICSIILLFIAVKKLPLGNAIAISYTYSVLVGFFACACLQEECRKTDVIFTVVTATGVLFIAQPPFIFKMVDEDIGLTEHNFAERILGVACAIGSALSNSITYVIVRKMGRSVHYTLSLVYYSWEGFFISLTYLLVTDEFRSPCFSDVGYVVLVSCFGLVGQIFMTIALQVERAGPVTLVQTTQIIFAFTFQYFLLNVTPNMYSGIGAVLIFVSSFGITLTKFVLS
ncbi:solute carrier family 35 member G1-like [Clavelina lepadiformis]|uniref:EamA domain-containing protein n=1 Tax=Clavelina lepadiformis TaxID=159417 RepID=A0ABP0GM06_CLALP